MEGMKDETKRITIPTFFPRVHLNDTARREGDLFQPFDSKTMTLISKHPTLPSPANIFDSLKVPIVRSSETHPQANTELSLQFHTSRSSKAVGSKILLSECLEDKSHNVSPSLMKTQLYRRNFAGFNNGTQKKPLPPRREQDASDSSVIDSLSGMNVSSYDVMRVIGDKKFWKMRTYMINQQKIFAEQVFELHRLIIVQKIIANSPNLILEMANHKPLTEEYPNHMKRKPPLPLISKELVNPIWPQQLLPPASNQWLVPVMSPLEGLVYKPYAGPCPPPSSSSFMVPVYSKDSLDTAPRFSVSSHNYFPPANARTTFDYTNPFVQFQRLSNTSSHMTRVIPVSLKKSQESNDSEVHGSTASSPPEKPKLDVLPLFPTEPMHQTNEYKQKQQPRLHPIKAIPHNPTSATESAAWGFSSIQEERRTQII